MEKRKLSLAKITPPNSERAYPRKRLFKNLDKSIKAPVVWIAAEGGAGKTTLVSSWLGLNKLPAIWYQIDEGDADIAGFFYYMSLAVKHASGIKNLRGKKNLSVFTPEYSQSLPVFTRRYFENLYDMLISGRKGDGPCVMVFDNYHIIPHESLFHEMMSHALDVIPEGIMIIFISRTLPPLQMARLQANNRLHLMKWEDIRFNREEFGGMLKRQTGNRPEAADIDILYRKTQGWVAGLILLTSNNSAPAAQAISDTGNLPHDRLFDYFAGEIFNKTDSTVQDLLLKTSYLDKIDSDFVAELTGNKMAGLILERFSREHFFTQKIGSAYQYHPLFRDFLKNRASSILKQEEIIAVQKKAAELLETTNMEEAIVLYQAAGHWDAARRVIENNAAPLLQQGRNRILEMWLNQFPEAYLAVSSWLLYWTGVCKMSYNPAEARGFLEKSYELFKSANDAAGLFLSWAKIVDSFVHEWGDARPADRWIEELTGLTQKYNFPSSEIEAIVIASMVGILGYRQPTHPNYRFWEGRLEKIVINYPDVDVKLMLGCNLMNSYNYISGNQKVPLIFKSLKRLSRKKDTTPMYQLFWCLQEANYLVITGDFHDCLQTLSWGLSVAEESGVHLLDPYILTHGIFICLAYNRPELMQFYLEKFYRTIHSPRLLDKSLYYFTEASIEWFKKNLRKSLEYGKIAIEFARAADSPWVLAFCLLDYSITLFDAGHYEEAKLFHENGGRYGKDLALTGFLYYMTGAKIYFSLGEDTRGFDFLKTAMKLGMKNGYAYMDRWNDQTMAGLCAKALEHDVEPEYAKFLIRKRNLVPDLTQPVCESWPYPVKIFTLGKFEILINDEPLKFSGSGAKVQQKPLALLKLLIILGGKDVDQTQIGDTLWPDAGGDSAQSSFEMALHRLRKLLGENVIELSDGKLTLNPAKCRIDLFVLERLMRMAENEWTAPAKDPEKAHNLTKQAVGMYREGVFFPGADYSHNLNNVREKLGGKIRRILLYAAAHLESSGDFHKALNLLEEGHSLDNLSEELMQRLMVCHIQLGQKTEAMRFFNSWRDRIMLLLNTTPSRKTMEIYNTMLNLQD